MQVRAPVEFQGTIFGDLNRRKGAIQNSDSEADEVVMQAQVCLQGANLTRNGISLGGPQHAQSREIQLRYEHQFLKWST